MSRKVSLIRSLLFFLYVISLSFVQFFSQESKIIMQKVKTMKISIIQKTTLIEGFTHLPENASDSGTGMTAQSKRMETLRLPCIPVSDVEKSILTPKGNTTQ